MGDVRTLISVPGASLRDPIPSAPFLLPHPSFASRAFQVGLGPVSGTHSTAGEDLVSEPQNEVEENGKEERESHRVPTMMGKILTTGLGRRQEGPLMAWVLESGRPFMMLAGREAIGMVR